MKGTICLSRECPWYTVLFPALDGTLIPGLHEGFGTLFAPSCCVEALSSNHSALLRLPLRIVFRF